MMRGFFYAFLTIVIASVGQIILKFGIDKSLNIHNLKSINNLLDFFIVFTYPLVLLGLVFYGLSAFLWIVVLSELDLSIAYPILGMTYIFVLLLSYFILGESLSMFKVSGTLLVLLGVVLIGFGSRS